MIDNRIGASTSLYFDRPLMEACERIRRLGFKTVELYRHSDELSLLTGEKLESFLSKLGITAVSWHDHHELSFVVNKNHSQKALYDEVRRRLDICAAGRIKHFVLHFGSIQPIMPQEERNAALEVLRNAAQYAQDINVKLIIETAGELLDVKSVLEVIKKIACDSLGICLDTGHVRIIGKSVPEEIVRAGKFLKLLHVQDNFGHGDINTWGDYDRHLTPGEGATDWKAVAKAYINSKSDAHLTLELLGYRSAREGKVSKRGYVDIMSLEDRDELLRKGYDTIKQAFTKAACVPKQIRNSNL